MKVWQRVLIFLLGWSILEGISTTLFAQEQNSLPQMMEERSLQQRDRVAIPEPEFLLKREGVLREFFYFGLGIHQPQMNLAQGSSLSSSEFTENGIVFNFGFQSDEIGFEYARSFSIFVSEKELEFNEQPYHMIEAILDNYWFVSSFKLSSYWSMINSIGIQFARYSLIYRPQNEATDDPFSGTTKSEDQISYLFGAGLTYEIEKNYFLQYLLAYSTYSEILSRKEGNHFSPFSFTHTLYLEYYFSL